MSFTLNRNIGHRGELRLSRRLEPPHTPRTCPQCLAQVATPTLLRGVEAAESLDALGPWRSTILINQVAAFRTAGRCAREDLPNVLFSNPVSYTHLRAHETDSY